MTIRITSINYKKTFNLGSYQSETVGVEIELTPEDDPEAAYQESRDLVHHWQSTTKPVVENPPVQKVQQNVAGPEMTNDEKFIAEMKASTHIDNKDDKGVLLPNSLVSWEKIVKFSKKKPEFQIAYDETLLKLQNK